MAKFTKGDLVIILPGRGAVWFDGSPAPDNLDEDTGVITGETISEPQHSPSLFWAVDCECELVYVAEYRLIKIEPPKEFITDDVERTITV